MTCENCVHYDVCFERSDLYWSLPIDELGKSCEKYCNEFKAKSRMVELPCAVGDVVWFITGIHCKIIKPAKIVEIIINETGISDLFVSTDNCSFENSFGTFFLTRKEAEKALKVRERKCLNPDDFCSYGDRKEGAE